MIKDCFCNTAQECDATMITKAMKQGTKKYLFACLIVFFSISNFAQLPDAIYMPNIASAQFTMLSDQTAMPVYNLNSADQLDLEFDDLDADTKSYYYTYQLCDYNWQPVDVSAFTYLKGFTQQNISIYRYSSIATTKYTHYQAILPDGGTTIILSGNYLLKVFLDGDTSKLSFTKKFLVVNAKASIAAKVVQPLNSQLYNTHQKIQMNANINGLNTFSATQQIKVVIMQNNRWDIALKDIVPTFVRGNELEYTTEDNMVFAAGKEWRWLDIRSFALHSDRVDSIFRNNKKNEIFLKPDIDRTNQKYINYTDLNGSFMIETMENINPYWQGDYATVHFTFLTSNRLPYQNKDIYLSGDFTGYALNDKTKMIFNAEKGMYEVTALLKQGYYNYTYIGIDKNDATQRYDFEGDYWETENNYTILMYYKSFEDRADELVGYKKINSRTAAISTGIRF